MSNISHQTETAAPIVIAVVGLSMKPDRPSHEVAAYMQHHGYRVVPVNPMYAGTYILNEPCYATLPEAAAALKLQDQRIDIVDCFRKSSAIGPIADEAIAIGAPCLWLQLGVINQAAADKASAAGIQVIMDRCIKIEHREGRLHGVL
ncbi:MAG: CoA-binding protein [Herbaspirillum sp.]